MARKALRALVFFTGWILSPFTWWNDAFVNLPLSYLLANLIFYVTRLPFPWLVIGSYWFTNAVGLLFMYVAGKKIIVSSANRRRSVIYILVFVTVYSTMMLYLERRGKLLPLTEYFGRMYEDR